MALSEDQKSEISSLYSTGKYSNRKIAEIVGVGNKVVGTLVKKLDLQKDTIDTLAKKEVHTIITANEIKTQKDTLTRTQKTHYDEAFIDYVHQLNVFDKAAVDNQLLNNLALEQTTAYIKEDIAAAKAKGKHSSAAMEMLPNIMAISKITEANKKLVFGITQPKEDKVSDDKIVFEMDYGFNDKDDDA